MHNVDKNKDIDEYYHVNYYPKCNILYHINSYIAIDGNRNVISTKQCSWLNRKNITMDSKKILTILKNRKVVSINKIKLFVMLSDYYYNFHHSLIEILPLIALYKEKCSKYKILINYDRVLLEILKIFNISNKNIVIFDNNKIYHGNFILSKYKDFSNWGTFKINFNHSYPFKDLINELINRCLKLTKLTKFPKKIWISRRKAKKRKLTNINKLKKLLKKHNYVELFTESFNNFYDQVATIYNANEIITELGAGCTNILYSKYNFKILFSDNAEEWATFYKQLGAQINCCGIIDDITKKNKYGMFNDPWKINDFGKVNDFLTET